MVANLHNPACDTVAIDYVVEGDHNAAAVVRGDAQLIGMSYATPGSLPRFVDGNIAGTLHRLGCCKRVYHDGVFSCAIELNHGLPLAPSFDDTHVMMRLLQADPPCEFERSRNGREQLVAASLARVGAMQANYDRLASELAAEGLQGVYENIEIPVVAPTLAMTMAGVRVNTEKAKELQDYHAIQIEIAKRQLDEIAGRPVNPDSPQASHELCRMPSPSGTAPAVKTSLRSYRSHKKVADAAASLITHANTSGFVHADLDPFHAATGRFSCRNPNLQGLPQAVLGVIEAEPGSVLMELDISQCELRILAHMSQDKRLIHAFRHGIDIHRETAAAALGVAATSVSKEQRDRVGKQINFALVYGMTPHGLAQSLDVSVHEAEQFLSNYFATYPDVRTWIDSIHSHVRQTGYVRTMTGRRRLLPDIWLGDPGALRKSVNTIIQGTAADLLKLALIRLHDVLPHQVQMLATCHDSVLLQVPNECVTEVSASAVKAMQSALPGLSVPIEVDVGCGQTWAECKLGK